MLNLRILSAADTERLQALLEQGQQYTRIATGEAVPKNAAAEIFAALPPGKKYDDKFVLGVYEDAVLVGCVDLIRGYPLANIVYIGLLLIAESHQGRGFGRGTFENVQQLTTGWQNCEKFRLGVLENNHEANRFWLQLGFQQTGESKPYGSGAVSSNVFIYERQFVNDRAHG